MDEAKAAAKYEKRKNAVEAVMRSEPVSLVARVHHVPQRTIFRWLSWYRTGGWHALLEGERSGRPRKVSDEDLAWLYNAITLGDPRQYTLPFCLWTLNLVRTVLKKERGIELSKSSVCRLLQHMGLSPQRPVYRSYKQDPKELERYLKKTFPELRALAKRMGAEIYFVDESAVRSDHRRGTTWGPVGQTPVVQDSGDRFGMKLISGVSPRGDMRFATIEGRMNSTRFLEFVRKLRSDAGRPIIVIADNAAYHTSGKVRHFAAQNKGEVTFAYLPRYAPELNPDEQVWNHAKARLSKLFVDSKETMKRSVLSILRSIQMQGDLIRSFFRMESTRYAAL
jgi:transposase